MSAEIWLSVSRVKGVYVGCCRRWQVWIPSAVNTRELFFSASNRASVFSTPVYQNHTTKYIDGTCLRRLKGKGNKNNQLCCWWLQTFFSHRMMLHMNVALYLQRILYSKPPNQNPREFKFWKLPLFEKMFTTWRVISLKHSSYIQPSFTTIRLWDQGEIFKPIDGILVDFQGRCV